MQRLANVQRVHNVIGLFNKAISNWVQRSNYERFNYVIEGPKNRIGYFLKRQLGDGTAENLPLPFLNSDSRPEDIDEKQSYEGWRYPLNYAPALVSRQARQIFKNDDVMLGIIQQRIQGTTEFEARFESYMEALDFQMEMIQMNPVNKKFKPEEFRYVVEIPKEFVYWHEKGFERVDMFAEGSVRYENLFSINQQKYFNSMRIQPIFEMSFPSAPEPNFDTESMDFFTVTFSIKWELELPMWLIFDTHHKVESFRASFSFDIISTREQPLAEFTQIWTVNNTEITYDFQEASQFDVTQTAIHDTCIKLDLLPAWNDTDCIRLYVDNTEISDFDLCDPDDIKNGLIQFKRYIESGSIIWVLRYSRRPGQKIALSTEGGIPIEAEQFPDVFLP